MLFINKSVAWFANLKYKTKREAINYEGTEKVL